ncbi:MAG: FtsX-like permease family protein [Solirubrobacteraceae bacterium]
MIDERRVSGSSRVLILALAGRAIRWRAAASVTVFVVAVVAILAATVGPIYLPAVDETVLARHLHGASMFQRDVLVSRRTELGYQGVDWDAQVRRLAGEFANDRVFARPLSEAQADVFYEGPGPLRSEIAYVEDLCAHVRIIRGRGLSGDSTSETLISAHTAAAEHLGVGGTLAAATPNGVAISLHVVGVYRPVAPGGPFWQPWYLFQFGQQASPDQVAPGDASFVNRAALSSRVGQVMETLSANVALRPGAVGYNDIAELQTTLARVNATVAHLTRRAGQSTPVASVTTGLATVLDQAAKETSLARTLVTVATAQLALLAIFLLYAVVANTTTAQGPEVALAKLRGRRAGSVLLQSVAQPVALVLAAAPVGALLAWVVVRLLAAPLLGHPVDVAFPPAAYGVAALGVLGGVLAAVVATRRIVVTPVGALMRLGAVAPGSATGLLVADAVAVTIAIAGLIELKAGGVLDSGSANPLSVLAPTLLAVAAAVVVLRLLPFLGRRLAGRTRDSPRLATFLAVRQLLRRPAEARAVLPVAVAVSIAAFAVTTWADSDNNRSLRALNSVGAQTVLAVRPGAGVYDLRTAVDRADPGGQSMAVAYTNLDRLPPLIAVDTARFAAVAAWQAGNSSLSLPKVLNRLSDHVAPVIVTGTRLRLRINLFRHPQQRVHVAVTFAQPNHLQTVRVAGPVAAGTGSYDISLPAACASGCRVTALALTANTPFGVGEIGAVIGALVRSDGGWRPLTSFSDHASWRGDGNGPVKLGSAGASLSLDVRERAGVWPSAVSAAIPAAVPAVVASAQAGADGGQIHDLEVVGVDRQALFVDGVMRAVTLPQVGRGGVMVDFGAALAVMNHPSASTTQYQVWLSADAPPNMAARLARQHVYVERTIRSATSQSVLDHSGPAFADSLFLLSALAAIVLAIGGATVGRVLSVRRRGYELAALEAVGVSPRTLRRATAAEQGSVFGIGLVVGLAAGLVGSWLALPSTPIFVHAATGPVLALGLPWALLAVLTLGMIVVFVVVSLATARVVQRAATPSLLRGAQQ